MQLINIYVYFNNLDFVPFTKRKSGQIFRRVN